MGIWYGFRCHWDAMALLKKERSLLLWGLSRFLLILGLTVVFTWLAVSYNHEIFGLIWQRPETGWARHLWTLLLWLFTLKLIILGTILAYIVSQGVFGALIADHMSQLTQRALGFETRPSSMGGLKHMVFIVKQEIPRVFVPVLPSVSVMILGWMIPFGFVPVILSGLVTSAFLAWDYTDLVPARELWTFSQRWAFFKKNLLGHIVLGLPFLIPFLNIFLLSLGPVSGTIFFLRTIGREQGGAF